MKILYVAPHDSWGASMSRLRALRLLGENVLTYDSSFVGREGGKFYSYFEGISGVGHTYLRANRELLNTALSAQPDVIWVDKGYWIWPTTLRKLKSFGFFLVQHNSDDINAHHARWHYRLLRQGLKYFDVQFTTNTYNVQEMLSLGASNVYFIDHAYDHERFFKKELSLEQRKIWSAPLVFAGHWEPKNEEYVSVLIRAGLPIKIYGWGWAKAKNPAVAQNSVDGYLLGEDYVNCLRGAEMCLGFLSKWNRNLSTMRIYEIPACGAFLLAERTKETVRTFAEGVEADFFDTPAELAAKARHYLENPAQRIVIANNGHQRCLSSKNSWPDRVLEMLTVMKKIYSTRSRAKAYAK